MRKSWVRFSIVIASAFTVFGQASAQSGITFWYNHQGDASGNQPAIINVTAGSSVTLSVYDRTTAIGPLSDIGLMFGYSTTTTAGSGAVRSDSASPLATFSSFSWGEADMTTFGTNSEGGGGGPADGVSRPFGYFATATGPNSGLSPFSGANNNDGLNFHVMDITLNISVSDAGGTNIPINIWSFANTDIFATAAYDASFNEWLPSSAYSGTLHVLAVPEPASMSALALGAIALIRRRRRSK